MSEETTEATEANTVKALQNQIGALEKALKGSKIDSAQSKALLGHLGGASNLLMATNSMGKEASLLNNLFGAQMLMSCVPQVQKSPMGGVVASILGYSGLAEMFLNANDKSLMDLKDSEKRKEMADKLKASGNKGVDKAADLMQTLNDKVTNAIGGRNLQQLFQAAIDPLRNFDVSALKELSLTDAFPTAGGKQRVKTKDNTLG